MVVEEMVNEFNELDEKIEKMRVLISNIRKGKVKLETLTCPADLLVDQYSAMVSYAKVLKTRIWLEGARDMVNGGK